jgi:hypothetical protein
LDGEYQEETGMGNQLYAEPQVDRGGKDDLASGSGGIAFQQAFEGVHGTGLRETDELN